MKRKFWGRGNIVLAFFFILIIIAQNIPAIGKIYAHRFYPYIGKFLCSISGNVSFSVYDLFIVFSIIGLIAYPILMRKFFKKKYRITVWHDIRYLLWIYIWFYLAWGLNYSQPDFYQRTKIPMDRFTTSAFKEYAKNYTMHLNRYFLAMKVINPSLLNEIKENRPYRFSQTFNDLKIVPPTIYTAYKNSSETLHNHSPFQEKPKMKRMTFSPLFSMFGVTGYYGPFFSECHLNNDITTVEYPFTYAHEYAHQLGITNEGEANFYAYVICTEENKNKYINFCGYFGVLDYFLNNAKQVLSDEEYQNILKRINPKIIQLARHENEYWIDKYSKSLGKIQGSIYDYYLKVNHIKNGRKNYSQVIGLIISYESYKESIKKK